VYCAVVLDVFSRRVVGWSIDSNQNAALVTNALGMAIAQRNPFDGTVIHSEYGPFRSHAFMPTLRTLPRALQHCRRHSALEGLPPISRLSPT
jgi:putative transposase